MVTGGLGKVYGDGEEIVRQGETGDCMYVIQTGQAEAIQGKEGKAVRLAVLGEGDIFGEMALHEDPSLAFRILQKMSYRIRELDNELVRIKTGC